MKALAILKILKSMTSLNDEGLQGDFNEAIAELEALQEKIAECEKPKLCGNCMHMEDLGKDFFVCNDTEFQTRTTPNAECFLGFKPKDK